MLKMSYNAGNILNSKYKREVMQKFLTLLSFCASILVCWILQFICESMKCGKLPITNLSTALQIRNHYHKHCTTCWKHMSGMYVQNDPKI